MTDAALMDADCIHGNPWYECDECFADVEETIGCADAEGEVTP